MGFCETRSKRSDELFADRNLDPSPPLPPHRPLRIQLNVAGIKVHQQMIERSNHICHLFLIHNLLFSNLQVTNLSLSIYVYFTLGLVNTEQNRIQRINIETKTRKTWICTF